jgi:RNA polymerase-binding transcription factor DksA
MATSKKQAKKPAAKPKSAKGKPAPAKAVKKTTGKPASKTAKAPPAKAAKKSVPAAKPAPKAAKAAPAKAAKKAVPAKAAKPAPKAAPAKAAKAAPPKAAPAKATPAKATKAAPAKAAGKASDGKQAGKPDPAPAPLKAGVPPPRVKTTPKEKPIPRLTKSPYDAKFLTEQKAMLLEERARYVQSATKYRVEADSLVNDREPGDVQFDEESGEGDSLAVERDFDLALSAQAQDKVAEIDAALSRIADNTYGICVASGQAIPKERLRAIPWATERIEYKVGGLGRRH